MDTRERNTLLTGGDDWRINRSNGKEAYLHCRSEFMRGTQKTYSFQIAIKHGEKAGVMAVMDTMVAQSTIINVR
jgi:hypothetical protein